MAVVFPTETIWAARAAGLRKIMFGVKIRAALADPAASDASLDEAPATAGKAPPFFYVLVDAHGARLVCCDLKRSRIRAMASTQCNVSR